MHPDRGQFGEGGEPFPGPTDRDRPRGVHIAQSGALTLRANELDDLASRLVADLLEADGYTVFYGGGNIAHDDILAEVHERRPDVLLMFSAGGADAPGLRQLIDHVRGINALPDMQIVVGGDIFNRAPGLAEEIGADLWATGPEDLLEQLDQYADVRANLEDRTVGRGKVKAA